MLFHLLGAGQPIANFTSASQTVNEADGVWAGWPAAYSAWTRRREVRIDGVTGALSNFPVMIKLDSTRIDYAQTQSAGQDLRFTDSAGTALSYEIESWDEAGTSIAWVKIPTLAAYPTTNTIWMYYGNSSASDAQTRTAVWDANHAGVWHFAGGATDSTSNAKNGAATGVSYVSGLAGQVLSLDGTTGNSIQPPNSMLVSVVFTVGAWFKTTANGVIVGHSNVAYSGGPGSWDPLLYVGTDGKLRGGTYAGQPNLVSNQTVNDGQWHYAVLTGNTNTQSLYLDGALQMSFGGTLSMASMIYNYIGMGHWSGWPSVSGAAWSTFNGQIDEVHISTSVRSNDWIQATYLSARDELMSFRSEETPTSGAAIVTVQLNTPAQSTVTIPYTVSGTAIAGTDHLRVSGNLTINGGNSSGSLNAHVLRDNLVEGSETAILTLGAPTGATLGTDTVHTVTIADELLSPPDAVDDSVTLTSISALTIPVLSNDSDVNGDTMRITAISAPASGTAVRVGQTILFTPSGDFGATDSFTYTISDGRGGSDTATVTLTYQIPFTWTGAGADTNWSTAGNWLGGVAPGVGNTVYFNNQCSAQCNPTFTANASVLGVRLNSSYTGTIVQNAAYTITTATGGWTQKAGTFTGAATNVTVGGNFVLSGGAFTAPSTTLAVNSGNFTVSGSATFAANGGLLTFGCGYSMTCSITPGAATYNNVTFAGFYAFYTLGGATMTIAGNLSMGDTYGPGYEGQPIDNGTLNVGGNVSIINRGNKGSATVRLTGNASGQTVTGQTGLYMPGLTIDAGSNAVTLVGNLNVSSHYTYVSSGTFTVTGNTLGLWCAYGATCNITPGTVAYNNVAFSGYYTTINLGGGTMTIDGNLSFGDTFGAGYTAQPLNNGTLNVKGNIAVTSWGFRGTAVINALGGTGTTLGQPATAGFPTGTFTVNKNAITDTMTLTSAVALYGAGQAMTITRGTVNLAGYNLTVPGALTVAANGKLICNGGTITAGSTSIVGEMSCGPTLGITWTGLAGDGLWSTAGNWTNNTIPGASDIAYFNGSCTNCNATINSAVTVKGIVMASSYTGTLTQGAGNTVTIGTSGWSQAGGTFSGGNSDISVAASFALSGGTFWSTSAVLILNSNVSITGSPTFTHNSGTVRFSTLSSGGTQNLSPGTIVFNNVDFNGYDTAYNLGGATMTVNGSLQLRDRGSYGNLAVLNNGTVAVAGDVTASLIGYGGSGTIRLTGNAAGQTISSVTTSSRYPSLAIQTGANSVTFSGNVVVTNNYTLTSVGTLIVTGSTLIIAASSGGTTQTLATGTNLYNNVSFVGYDSTWNLSSGTLNVGGTLTISDTGGCCYRTLNSGTINAYGDVSASGNWQGGTALIRVVGAGNQTVTGVATAGFSSFEIASTSGVVTFAGALKFVGNFTYTSGTVDAGASTVNFDAQSGVSQTVTPGPIVLNNVSFTGYTGTTTISGSVDTAGALTIAGSSSSPYYTINTGNILARGSVTASGNGAVGTAVLKFAGSASQTFSGVASAFLPAVEVVSTGGTVAYTGTMRVNRSYVHTSGTVDAATATLKMEHSSATTHALTPGATAFSAVELAGYTSTYNVTGTLTVNGLLTLSGNSSGPPATYNGGAITANGNVTFVNNGIGGTIPVTFGGSSSTTLSISTGSVSRPTGTVTIAKTGGASVTMVSDASFGSAGQDITVSSGTFDLGGYDLTVTDVLTVGAGTTLRCNGGNFTSASLVNGGTVNCPGYGGYEFNWTGAGGDTNWNTAANWSGGVAPSGTSVVVFNDTYCGANCNSTIATSVDVKGIQMQSPYTGTVTQASGAALTVGTRGWTQAAGIFTGSDAAVSVAGALSVSGGTYTATSNTTILNGALTIGAGVTFSHNNGSTVFAGSTTRTLSLGGHPLYDVTFYPGGSTGTTSFSGNLIVDRNLTVVDDGAGFGATTIDVKGNVTTSNWGFDSTSGQLVNVKLTGSGAQTVTAGAGLPIPSLEFASSGTVTLTGTIPVRGHLKYTSGTVVAGSSTIQFAPTTAGTSINLGSLVLNDFNFATASGSTAITGTLNVGSNLLVADDALGVTGAIAVSGNTTISSFGFDNSGTGVTLSMVGASVGATFTQTGGVLPKGPITVNKTSGGSVVLASNLNFNGANQDLTITSGTLDMAGYSLTVARNISNSGTLKRGNSPSCGALSYGGTYSGTAAICP